MYSRLELNSHLSEVCHLRLKIPGVFLQLLSEVGKAFSIAFGHSFAAFTVLPALEQVYTIRKHGSTDSTKSTLLTQCHNFLDLKVETCIRIQ